MCNYIPIHGPRTMVWQEWSVIRRNVIKKSVTKKSEENIYEQNFLKR